MSDMNKPEENSQAVPFFARYLEGQFREDLSKEEMEAVKGGSQFPIPSITRKSPSDLEDWLPVTQNKFLDDVVVTMKAPSDNDEEIILGFNK
ncbi:MAG: microviridin/marinostatin family tricyclic proteinase inhibitor [Moorea sp. SIOASIH]|uniref:microviridin/marinostatin family tricyclic proteinase inhibitor n=1 Tax=Moorena sp. SIOASIH TaxID=2607817 RepID=UPI0013BC014C|nr:microviridin/marinostatin family tricyclic proteinase inhibitor [Moorena sp. SIOASIH]NEO41738.1 microviridin/marinostatin family tricyclic proteinase inhibitor [Moorena sp. SIOASIH]